MPSPMREIKLRRRNGLATSTATHPRSVSPPSISARGGYGQAIICYMGRYGQAITGYMGPEIEQQSI